MLLEAISTISSELTSEISSEITSKISSEMSSVGEAISSSDGIAIPPSVQPVADWIQKAWEWMNQPLPIVGFSLIAVIIFLWRFLTTTSVGKKALKKMNEAFEQTKADTGKALEEYRAENEALKKQLAQSQEDMQDLRSALEIVCANSRNKNVKNALKEVEKPKEEPVEEEEVSNGKEAEKAEETVNG